MILEHLGVVMMRRTHLFVSRREICVLCFPPRVQQTYRSPTRSYNTSATMALDGWMRTIRPMLAGRKSSPSLSATLRPGIARTEENVDVDVHWHGTSTHNPGRRARKEVSYDSRPSESSLPRAFVRTRELRLSR